MASSEKQLQDKLIAAIQAVQDHYNGTVTRITIEPQPSGECPYQVSLLEEQYPEAALVALPSPS